LHFFGVDLAFASTNFSGLCVLDETGVFVGSGYGMSNEDIVAFVNKHAHPTGNVLVVDAPLICIDESGQRPCETRVGQLYGRHHASCHSSNTKNRAGQRGPKLLREMEQLLPIHVKHDARDAAFNLWPVMETYPHPGHIELFELDRILKYKKGRVGEKRSGLTKYVTELKKLENREPALQADTIAVLSDPDIDQIRGNALKLYEDMLDAVFCAYVALHLWRHREASAKWRVVEAEDNPDYITVPLL
jgi:predicted RNase H-like nuclease